MPFLFIFLVVYAVTHTSDIKKTKELIIDKGVSEDIFDIYIIGVWIYLIPPLIQLLLNFILKQYSIPPMIANLYLPILASFYLPAVIAGTKIYKKFDRGYDFERRIGNKISYTLWIGYGTMTIFVVIWVIKILRSLS